MAHVFMHRSIALSRCTVLTRSFKSKAFPISRLAFAYDKCYTMSKDSPSFELIGSSPDAEEETLAGDKAEDYYPVNSDKHARTATI